jgi:hypothetical protein
MPLKLNIAISRKIGEPNYGSRGATVGLEMEVDSSLVNEPRKLHERIARLFRLANKSIDAELGCRPADGQHGGSANGSSGRVSGARPVTPNQIRAIRTIADRHDVDLEEELLRRFQLQRLEDLSLDQASQLIDAIKPSANRMTGQ